jgi:hypothetical protein
LNPVNTKCLDPLGSSGRSVTLIPTIFLQSSSMLDAPPFQIIGATLMAMGYKKSWIELVIKQNKTTHIPTIHRILREQKEEFIKTDLANERKHYEAISARLNPSIDIVNSSKFDTNELITNTTQHFLKYWNSSQASKQTMDENAFEVKSHTQDIHHDVIRWIRDKVSMAEVTTNIYRLLDLNQSEQDSLTTRKSLHYSHQNISSKQYLNSRIATEHGLTMHVILLLT